MATLAASGALIDSKMGICIKMEEDIALEPLIEARFGGENLTNQLWSRSLIARKVFYGALFSRVVYKG